VNDGDDEGEASQPSNKIRFSITPNFKFAVYAVSLFIVVFVSLDTALTLAFDAPTEGQRDLIGYFADAWKGGVGAWLGLIGGKTLD
jgi:hypothetical protein